ncbi:MAG: 23S rRNA pseudouridine(2604) synthase RluF [Idiomarina sp.]|nr:23S rRNA pseudouridine(2604) synthase RluF [Idiomarina sp.]
MSDMPTVRLNKFISESGICSRREADRFIEQGLVLINGRPAEMGEKVTAADRVTVNGRVIEPQDKEKFVFIALNKPVGIVSTTDPAEKDNMVNFIRHPERIFPIGRLDKDSQGLIFLTSNGDLVNKILRAGNQHEKEYIVTVDKPITDEFIRGMASGVPILGQMTKKCRVQKVSRFVFRIILIQGLNRQIRRMCEHFDYRVRKLERIRIMNVELKGLKVGEWRDLNEKELSILLKSIEHSSSEAPPGHRRAKSQQKSPHKTSPKSSNQTAGKARRSGPQESNRFAKKRGPAAGKPTSRRRP